MRIDSRCLDSGEPIVARMKDGNVSEVSPSSAVGHINVPMPEWEEHTWAFN